MAQTSPIYWLHFRNVARTCIEREREAAVPACVSMPLGVCVREIRCPFRATEDCLSRVYAHLCKERELLLKVHDGLQDLLLEALALGQLLPATYMHPYWHHAHLQRALGWRHRLVAAAVAPAVAVVRWAVWAGTKSNQ